MMLSVRKLKAALGKEPTMTSDLRKCDHLKVTIVDNTVKSN